MITEALITAGSDINHGNTKQGNKPLYYIIEVNSLKVIKLLINYDTEITALNFKNQTALYIAAKYSYKDIILLLLTSGTKINKKDIDYTTLLYLAYTES